MAVSGLNREILLITDYEEVKLQVGVVHRSANIHFETDRQTDSQLS